MSSVSVGGEDIPLVQNFYLYEGANGNNEVFANRSSGAYIFRPNSTITPISGQAKLVVTKGQLVDEVQQVRSFIIQR